MTIRQLVKKYKKYIESYEYDEEVSEHDGESNYWVYLNEPYETDYGTASIHDTVSMIEYYLEEIAERYK